MSRKKDIRDWTELIDDLEKMCAMPCKPTRHRLKPDTVINEDKSVKWNREEVQRQNDLYEQEVKDLNTKKNKVRDSLYDEVIEKIADETDLPKDKVKPIWSYAYAESHSYGIRSVVSTVEELIDLFNDVLK